MKYDPAEIQEITKLVPIGNEWDVILVGDGSASRGPGACAWGVVLYDRRKETKHTFYGGLSGGSSIIAELMPYVHAMLWFSHFRGKAMRRQEPEIPIRVKIVTDCASLAKQGNRASFLDLDIEEFTSVDLLLSILSQLEDTGYEFEWFWKARGQLTANKDMNLLAQAVRWKLAEQSNESERNE